MGLSLRSIGKKIEDVIGGVERQVNPFDNGATYSNPQPQRPVAALPQRPGFNPGQPQPASQQVPFRNAMQLGSLQVNNQPLFTGDSQANAKKPNVNLKRNFVQKTIDQFNPLDNGRTFKNPTPANNRSAVSQIAHSGLSNLAGDLTFKPFVQAPYQTGSAIGTTISDMRTSGNTAADANKILPALYQTAPGWVFNQVENSAKAGADLAFRAPIADLTGHPKDAQRITGEGLRNFNQTVIGGVASPVERALINLKPQKTQAATQTEVGLDPKATGAQKYIGTPVSSAAALVGLKAGLKGAADKTLGFTSPKVALSDKPSVGLKTDQPATIPNVSTKAAPATKAKTGFPQIDQLINQMHAHYNSDLQLNGNALSDITASAKGKAAAGQLIAGRLGYAIRKTLGKDADRAIYDELQEVNNPHRTPETAKIAKALRGLNGRALQIRQEVDPNVHQVGEYAPRVLKGSVANAVKSAKGTAQRVKAALDIGSLESNFSKSRQNGKFVDEQGKAIFGKPTDLGLIRHQDGTISTAAGKVYKQVVTNTHELQDKTGLEYLDKAGHVSSLYHADTAKLQAKAAALKELNSNPTAHGLFTKEQVEAGGLDGMKEVTVPKLKDQNGESFYAKVKDAKQLERDSLFGHPDARSLPGKVYDAFSSVATQFIVLNPLFHGANQLIQSMIASGNISGHGGGWIRLAKGMATVTDEDTLAYLNHSGHIPDYGSHLKNIVSRATGGLTKVPPKMMAALELRYRVGLYKASIEGNMTPEAAVANIDRFLGDQHQMSRATQRMTLFLHYFKTMTNALYQQGRHPVENKGATINIAVLAALNVGLNQQYQEFMGNKNAYLRSPGELGLGKEIIGTVKGLAHGDASKASQVVTNKVNPVAKEALQQAFNKDLFTGKSVRDTPGQSLAHAKDALIAPAQIVSRMTNDTGKGPSKSAVETLENQAGFYSPHAKGDVATTNPDLAFLNTSKAKVAPGNDPTGYKQQQTYFDTTKQAKKPLSSADRTLYDQLTASTTNLNDKQIQAHYGELSGSPKVLEAIAKQKQEYAKRTGTQLDPLYSNDITPEQRQAYLHMLSTPYKGDDYIQQQDANGGTKQENGWMYKLTQARNDYFDKTDFNGASKAERVQPPKFDAQTEADLTATDKLEGKDKALFIQAHPDVQQAYDSLAKYTNDKRVAQGNAPFKLYPGADPATQAALSEMNAVPKGGGSKGGNKYVAQWIQANPDKYAKIQNYYTAVSEWELANSAGSDKYQGATPSQQELKSAYNLGQYDIAVTKNADGTKTYALNPSAAASAYGGSYSGSGSSSSYSSSRNSASRRAYKDSKALRYTNKIPKINARIKKASVKGAKGNKLTVGRASKNKVAAKSAGMVVTKSKV